MRYGGSYGADLIGNVMAHSLWQSSKYLAHVPNNRMNGNSFSISIKPARMHISKFLRFATSDVVDAALNYFARNQSRNAASRGAISVSGWLFPWLGQYVGTRLVEGQKRNGFKLRLKIDRFSLYFEPKPPEYLRLAHLEKNSCNYEGKCKFYM